MHSTMDLPLTYLTEVRSMLEPDEGKASLEPSMILGFFMANSVKIVKRTKKRWLLYSNFR